MSKVILTGQEIMKLVAKYGELEYPQLKPLNGKNGKIVLKSTVKEFWIEIEEDSNNA